LARNAEYDFKRHADVGHCLQLEKRVSVKPVAELVHRDVRAIRIKFVPNSECRPGRLGRSDVIGWSYELQPHESFAIITPCL